MSLLKFDMPIDPNSVSFNEEDMSAYLAIRRGADPRTEAYERLVDIGSQCGGLILENSNPQIAEETRRALNRLVDPENRQQVVGLSAFNKGYRQAIQPQEEGIS